MGIQDWVPAITTSGLLGVALWLARNLVVTRLKRSVDHEFGTKLEALKHELRASEERLKADLRANEAEIAALRSGPISAMASRQMAVDKRRLEAVDQLWAAATALAPARGISNMMGVINFEVAAKRAEHDPKTRQFFETVGGGFDPKSLDLGGAAKARPFVSPMAWATYGALLAVCIHAIMRWNALRFGLGEKEFVDKDAISKLIKSALPHFGDFVDKFGPAGYHHVLEALEAKLLQELQAVLAGAEADKAGIEQAAEILRRSSEVLTQATSGQPTA